MTSRPAWETHHQARRFKLDFGGLGHGHKSRMLSRLFVIFWYSFIDSSTWAGRRDP